MDCINGCYISSLKTINIIVLKENLFVFYLDGGTGCLGLKLLTMCQLAAQKILPSIRASVALALLERGYSVKNVAELLEMTPAAISNYKYGKRGGKLIQIIMKKKEYRERVEKIIDLIVEDGKTKMLEERVRQEICNLCKRIRENECIEY
jgi:predicted transcriptional regulator